MKVLFILDETRFFHPKFFQELLERMSDECVAVGIVTKIPEKGDLNKWLRKNWRLLKVREILKLVFQSFAMALKERCFPLSKKNLFSISAVSRFYKIPSFEIQNSINEPHTLEVIRSYKPDVIVSSCSLIFGKDLLSIPRLMCLNRHSGLLPSYGGLWPVFQAYRRGERFTGVSIHRMTPKVDAGEVLVQQRVEIQDGRTIFELYEKCFEVSVDAVLRALDKVRAREWTPIANDYQPSYFSFPLESHWDEFRMRGGKFA